MTRNRPMSIKLQVRWRCVYCGEVNDTRDVAVHESEPFVFSQPTCERCRDEDRSRLDGTTPHTAEVEYVPEVVPLGAVTNINVEKRDAEVQILTHDPDSPVDRVAPVTWAKSEGYTLTIDETDVTVAGFDGEKFNTLLRTAPQTPERILILEKGDEDDD